MKSPVLQLLAVLILLCAAVSKEIDTVFIIDGSGSIDSNEFYLQKQGVESAINTFVPEDGTHSVTLVQYGSSTTRTHLSRTVISSAADKSSAISVVQSASQIGGGTNPGDGINAATAILNSGYNSAAEQIFCLSTDGTRNSGASMSSALSSAKAASFALDGLAIVAIENGGGSVTTLTNYYSPYAYNKEFMMTKANLRDFVTTFGTACYADSNVTLSLVALEVTQSVQNLNNTAVPLIQSKDTWVRAYIKSQATADPTELVKARLHGIKSDGTSLPNSPIVADQNFRITDPIGQRDSKSATSNFLLEESWTQQNDPITLRIEVVGHHVECVDTAVDNGCGAVVSFQESDPLVAVIYKMTYRECLGCPDIGPTDSDVLHMKNQLLAMLPLHKIEYVSQALTYNSDGHEIGGVYHIDAGKALVQIIDAHKDKAGFALGILGSNAKAYDYHLGAYTQVNGIAIEAYRASISIFRPISYPDRGKYTPAHEIAHTYGVSHTAYINPSTGQFEGVCNSRDGTIFKNVKIDTNGEARAIIGPFNNPQNYVFGWNSFEDVIIDPFQHFALMSYCGPNYRWISDVTYKYLASALKHTRRLDAVTSSSTRESVSVSSAATVSVLQFEVWIDVKTCDSNVVSVTARDVPSSMVAQSVQYSVNDTYFLQTYDAGNVALGGYAFTPSELLITPLTFNFSTEGNDGTSLELVYVPYSAQIASANLVCGGQVKAAAASSTNAPTVTVLYPNGGESILGTYAEFLWTASDADGDALTFDVSYSNDGGSTWADVAIGLNGTSVNVTVADLGKTTAGKLRVRVSDGFNNAVDESDGVFVTPNAVPSVTITSHMNSVHFYSGVQSILLHATAYDREDGVLPDSSLKWYSDLDGLIGTGQSVSTSADQFQVGTHAVTVVATDSDSDTATAGVRIVVSIDELPITQSPTLSPSSAAPSALPTESPSLSPTDSPTLQSTSWAPISGLALYLPFSGNANDNGGGSFHGNVYGATLAEDRFENANSAYDFDGSSSYIHLPVMDGSDAESNGALTVSWWQMLRNFDNTQSSQVFPVMESGTLSFRVEVGPSLIEMQIASWSISCNSVVIPSDTWTHITISFDDASDRSKVYLNGVLECSSSAVNFIPSTSGMDLYIGKGISKSVYADGVIDEIRMYSRQLNDPEVMRVFTDQGHYQADDDGDDDGDDENDFTMMILGGMVIVALLVLFVILIGCCCGCIKCGSSKNDDHLAVSGTDSVIATNVRLPANVPPINVRPPAPTYAPVEKNIPLAPPPPPTYDVVSTNYDVQNDFYYDRDDNSHAL